MESEAPTKEQTGADYASEHESDESTQDAKDMARLGKKQQLLRQFDLISILGFACVTMITWEGLLITFVYGLSNGGPAGLVYGFIFVWLGYAFAIASLAEMMSMWPTSGGQYHWTYTLAPPRWAPFISYICGWQSVVAWQACTASATYLEATMLQGLAVLNYADYTFERWHGTLIMYAVLALILVFSLFCNRLLPKLDYLALAIHVCGFVVVVVVIAVLSPARAPSEDVFDVWFNAGYTTQGVSWLVGLQGIVFAWLGADGPIHMAEEIKGAARVVPWALMGSVVINGLLGFGVLLVILFFGPTGQDLQDALASQTGYPIEAIFTYATGSTGGSTGLMTIILIMGLLGTLMLFTATSRETWALARDNALPGSSFLARVDKKTKLPLYTIALTWLIATLLALINIGSALAFNAIISMTIAGYIGSYAFPISLLIWRKLRAARGFGAQLPYGPWRLGPFGIVINVIALCWILIIFVFSFFPVAPLPALTVQTMNWSSLAYGAVTLFAAGFWFLHGRRTFRGPVRDAAGGDIEAVLSWTQGLEASSR